MRTQLKLAAATATLVGSRLSNQTRRDQAGRPVRGVGAASGLGGASRQIE